MTDDEIIALVSKGFKARDLTPDQRREVSEYMQREGSRKRALRDSERHSVIAIGHALTTPRG